MLGQWQMWWWYWFFTIIALYALMLIRAKLNSSESLNPTLNTSTSSKGKWGDFLVATIPLTWCGNILVNSNFILRMIEWQNEASLLTIRIQGKQWYWSYKYSGDSNYRLQSLYINVGNDNWLKSFNPTRAYFNYQNSTLLFVFDCEFRKLYKENLGKKRRNFKFLNASNYNSSSSDYFSQKGYKLQDDVSPYKIFNSYFKKIIKGKYNIGLSFKKLNFNYEDNLVLMEDRDIAENLQEKYKKNSYLRNNFKVSTRLSIFWNDLIGHNFKDSLENDTLEDAEETSENLRYKDTNFPIKVVRGVLNNHNVGILSTEPVVSSNIILNYTTNTSNIAEKIPQVEQFWGFKQKKYKKMRAYKFNNNHRYDSKTYRFVENYTNTEKLDRYSLYASVKNNKRKGQFIPLTLAKRLLRVKRTLVLPAHVNLTLITSSYDVVHSWFVPGLGVKIDCVPGRSTHHSLYIDHVGIYFGQCAEICGRYHHHMPIRVAVLSMEHFLLWWRNKGMRRMYRQKGLSGDGDISKKSILLQKFKQ